MISIITPCKNIIAEGRAEFFKEMMATLEAQTFQDFEHIVVDGDSKDGTAALLREYLARGLIDRLISEKDNNVHEAMNKGIKLAKGEFIHVMNSDNYFATPYFFERSLKALQTADVDFTHADRSIAKRAGGPTTIKRGDERVAFFRMPFRYQTMLIRRAVYDEIGPFDEKYVIAGDYKLMMQMLLAGKRGYYFPEIFICSLDGGITSDRQRCIDEVTRVLYEVYGEKYHLTLRDCQNIYLRKLSPQLFSKIKSNVKNEKILQSLTYCYNGLTGE